MIREVDFNLPALYSGIESMREPACFGDISVIIQDKIAEGGYGTIFKATDPETNIVYAVKSFSVGSSGNLQTVKNEFLLQHKFSSHPNVVQVYGMIVNEYEGKALILMEYCDNSLVNLLNSRFGSQLSIPEILNIFIPVCDVINQLHTNEPSIAFRDIKIENVMFKNGITKLTDFGSATSDFPIIDHDKDTTYIKDLLEKNTTPGYRSPEIIDLYRSNKVDTKADVWALGCLLFKICTFKDAFSETEPIAVFKGAVNWPLGIPLNIKDLCAYCLKPEPILRPSVAQVLGKAFELFPEQVDPKYKLENTPFDPFANGVQVAPEFTLKRSNSKNIGDANSFEFEDEEDEQDPFAAACKQCNSSSSNYSFSSNPFNRPNSQSSFDPFARVSSSMQSDPFSQPSAQINPFNNPSLANQADPFAQFDNSNKFDPFSMPQLNQFSNTENQFDPFSHPSKINTSLIETDQDLLERQLLKASEEEIRNAISDLMTVAPNATCCFLLDVIPRSGDKAAALLAAADQPRADADEQLAADIAILTSVFDAAPALRGDFSGGADAAAVHPLLTLVEAVCETGRERLLDGLGPIAAGAFNAALRAAGPSPRGDMAERLSAARELAAGLLERLGLHISLGRPL